MGDILMAYWASYGERAYADWFRSIYLHVRWDRWHVTGAGVGGVLPSQQGIEAHHSVIKKTCAPSPRASTNGVLKGILPRILRLDGERLCPASTAHYCEGPVPPEMLAKAQRLVASTRNYCKLNKGRGSSRRLIAIIFNAAKFMVGGAGILGAEVDQQRAKKFVRSLEGKFPKGLKALEIEYELLSLHRVTIGTVEPEGQLQLDPVWSMTSIQIVRSYVQCDCESYVRTGWVCSHALAALSLQGFLDLNAVMASVPVRRAPGRPPNRRPALTRESREEGYFNVDRLVRLFLQRPGQPLKWKVIADMEVEVEGDIESSMFIGQVVGLRLSDGVYIWSVRFADGDLCDYQAEQLARAVNRAHELGVNVASE